VQAAKSVSYSPGVNILHIVHVKDYSMSLLPHRRFGRMRILRAIKFQLGWDSLSFKLYAGAMEGLGGLPFLIGLLIVRCSRNLDFLEYARQAMSDIAPLVLEEQLKTLRRRLTTPGRSSSMASGFSSTGIHSSVSLTRPIILMRGLVDF
jgi:hypothetical protein